MKFLPLLSSITLGASLVSARSPQHVDKKLPETKARAPELSPEHVYKPRKASANSAFLTAKTKKTVVNGTVLPDVDFNIGESYARSMPINNKTNGAELYFWFFPSSNPKAEKEITICLNGGPGCSSLGGLTRL
jgi:carboxypeptidase D